MPATDEQLKIINLSAAPGSITSVQAYAGTGKTWTLKTFAEKNSHKKILYIVFNKSTQEEARKKFPKNVICKTSHALAFSCMNQYRKKLKLQISVQEYRSLMDEDWNTVRLAVNGLSNFMNSADSILCRKHILGGMKDTDKIPDFRIRDALRAATDLWEKQADEHSDTPCTSNTVLKIFQLSCPQLHKMYDVILFDEAQDANPVTLDIMLNNECAKIFVGDSHQTINGWRGARNALAVVEGKGAQILRLTKSFRFGSLIAGLASVILEMKGETQPLTGLAESGDILTASEIISAGFYASVSRTFSGVIMAAYEGIANGRRVMWNGGTEKYNLTDFEDVHFLRTGEYEYIQNKKLLSTYKNWDDYKGVAKITEDNFMNRTIRLLESFPDIPSLIKQLRQNEVRDLCQADMLVTTAHTAKGLEWDRIVLSDDFPIIQEMIAQKKSRREINEEMNLLYVAITRGKKAVTLNSALMMLLNDYEKKKNGQSVVILPSA